MPITERQRQARKKRLGSSDMAALFGLDPFKSAYDVWLEKTQDMKSKGDSKWTKGGSSLENAVLDLAEGEGLGKIKRNCFRKAKGTPLGSNVDGIVVGTGEPVEAKTSGLYGPVLEKWGEAGTDEVPDRVIIQCQVHIICTGKDVCHVPVLIGGRGLVIYHVKRDETLCNLIIAKAKEFMEKNVKGNVPPSDSVPSLPNLKRVVRQPNTVVELEEALVNRWLDAKASKSMVEEEVEAAQKDLLIALGTADAGKCSLGMVTYFESTSNRVDTDKLKTQFKDIYSQCIKESKSRTLRFSKA